MEGSAWFSRCSTLDTSGRQLVTLKNDIIAQKDASSSLSAEGRGYQSEAIMEHQLDSSI